MGCRKPVFYSQNDRSNYMHSVASVVQAGGSAVVTGDYRGLRGQVPSGHALIMLCRLRREGLMMSMVVNDEETWLALREIAIEIEGYFSIDDPRKLDI